jgi:hypothetical protein
MRKIVSTVRRKGWNEFLPDHYRRIHQKFILQPSTTQLESKPSFIQAPAPLPYTGRLDKVGSPRLHLDDTHKGGRSVLAPPLSESFSFSKVSEVRGARKSRPGTQSHSILKKPFDLGVLPPLFVVGRAVSPMHKRSLIHIRRAARRNLRLHAQDKRIATPPLKHKSHGRELSPLMKLRMVRPSTLLEGDAPPVVRRSSFSSSVFVIKGAQQLAKKSAETLHIGDDGNIRLRVHRASDGPSITIDVNFNERSNLQDGVAAGKMVQKELFKLGLSDIKKMTINFRGSTSMDFVSFYSVFGPWSVAEKEYVVHDMASATALFDTLGSTGFQGLMLTEEKIGKDVVVRFPSNFKALLASHIQETKLQYSDLDLDKIFDEYAALLEARTFTKEEWAEHIQSRRESDAEKPLTGFVFDQPPVDPLKKVRCTRHDHYPYDPKLRQAIANKDVVANSSDQNTAIGYDWSFDPGNPPLTQIVHDEVKEGRPHVHVLSHHHHDHNAYLWLLLKAVKENPELSSTFKLLHNNSLSSKRQLVGLLLSDPKAYLPLNSVLRWVGDGDVHPLETGSVTICAPTKELRHFIDSVGAVFLNVSKVTPGVMSFDVTHMMGDVNTQFMIKWDDHSEEVVHLFKALYTKVFDQVRARLSEAREAYLESGVASEIGEHRFKLNMLSFFEIGHVAGIPDDVKLQIYDFINEQTQRLKEEGLVDEAESKVAEYHMKCEEGYSSGKAISPSSRREALAQTAKVG